MIDYKRQHIDVQETDWKSYHVRFLEHARMYIACYEYRNLAVCVKTLFFFLEIIHGYWNIKRANAWAVLCSADISKLLIFAKSVRFEGFQFSGV